MNIYFRIDGQNIKRVDCKNIAADSMGFLYALFEFGEEWDALTKKAVFTQGEGSWSQLLDKDKCLVPNEVLREGYFTVSVIGIGDGEIRATTCVSEVEVSAGPELESENASTPTATEIEQLTAVVASVREDADNGMFDGEDGTDGVSFEIFSTTDEIKAYPTKNTATAVRFIWIGDDTEYRHNITVPLKRYGVYDGILGTYAFQRVFTEILEAAVLPAGVAVGENKPVGNENLWVEVNKYNIETITEGEVSEEEPVNYADGIEWEKDGTCWYPETGVTVSTTNEMVRTGNDSVIPVKEGENYRIYGFFGDGSSVSTTSYNLGVLVKADGSRARGLKNTSSEVLYFPEGDLNDESYYDIQVPTGKSIVGMRLNAYYTSTDEASNGIKVYKFKDYDAGTFVREEITETKTLSESAVVKYKNSKGEYQPVKSMSEMFGKLYLRSTYGTDTKVLPYWFCEPYNPENKALPLIVVLHSSHTKQLIDQSVGLGIGENLDYMVNNFIYDDIPKYLFNGEFGNVPAYIVMPQTDGNSLGWAQRGEEIVKLVDLCKKEFSISKVGIIGYSLGGTGAWELAAAYPDVFDCIVPIAGGLDGCTNHIKPYIQPSGEAETRTEGCRSDLSDYLDDDYSDLSVDSLYMKSKYTTNDDYKLTEDDAEYTAAQKFVDARIADTATKLISGNVKVLALIGESDSEVDPYVTTELYKRITGDEYIGEVGVKHSNILNVVLNKRAQILEFLLEV